MGKAKNLKKRVTSYFTKNQSGKTQVLLKRTVQIRHVIVENESDALFLENNLIKKLQPKYNILLKDDKTFPWICIKNEPFPRVFSTRNVIKDGSSYYGPYTSGLMVKTLLTLIRQLYQLRTCSHSLTNENISAGKFKVCLEYHIGNCKAPCIGMQRQEEYSETISQIRNILKGNISSVIDHLKTLMLNCSREMRFEEAQTIKDKIDLLSKYKSRSTIVSTTLENVDVFGYAEDAGNAYINYLKVFQGAVIQTYTLELRSRIEEEKESLLGIGITEIRQRLESDSIELIVPFKPDILVEKLRYTVPEIGDKKKLLDLASRNAIYFKLEQKKKNLEKAPEARTNKNLERVMKDLHMPQLPYHIECFDNSNIMGSNPVAACVVFRNAKPSKKDYRHFNIKTVLGPDDFGSMEEVVYRRYKRMLDENQKLPQLIIIDGGKGQLSSAMKSIERLELREKITMIPHGTHLVPHSGARFLKKKYGLTGRKVLSTFGLLSSGKSIETTLEALPAIVEQSPEVVFLVIGKTHPEVVKSEGEKYRQMLEQIKRHLAAAEIAERLIAIRRGQPLGLTPCNMVGLAWRWARPGCITRSSHLIATGAGWR